MSAEHLVCAYVNDSPCGICTMRLDDFLRGMPKDGATKSRDYGRGYAQAVRDVQALIASNRSETDEAAGNRGAG